LKTLPLKAFTSCGNGRWGEIANPSSARSWYFLVRFGAPAHGTTWGPGLVAARNLPRWPAPGPTLASSFCSPVSQLRKTEGRSPPIREVHLSHVWKKVKRPRKRLAARFGGFRIRRVQGCLVVAALARGPLEGFCREKRPSPVSGGGGSSGPFSLVIHAGSGGSPFGPGSLGVGPKHPRVPPAVPGVKEDSLRCRRPTPPPPTTPSSPPIFPSRAYIGLVVFQIPCPRLRSGGPPVDETAATAPTWVRGDRIAWVGGCSQANR